MKIEKIKRDISFTFLTNKEELAALYLELKPLAGTLDCPLTTNLVFHIEELLNEEK